MRRYSSRADCLAAELNGGCPLPGTRTVKARAVSAAAAPPAHMVGCQRTSGLTSSTGFSVFSAEDIVLDGQLLKKGLLEDMDVVAMTPGWTLGKTNPEDVSRVTARTRQNQTL